MKSIKRCASAIFLFTVLLQNISAQNRSFISENLQVLLNLPSLSMK
jgi:hypothetical protein